jgi:hypothetical protein
MFDSFRDSKGRLPLILGVTGHRDLRPEDLPELKPQIQKVLGEIHKQWSEPGGEGAAPIYLLSGMAEGADQLAAEAALEMGIKVIAVLPMPLEEYETDFPQKEGKLQLRVLLSRASGIVTMARTGEKRETQYEAAGTYISRNSSLLIALWDGIHINKIGGTSHVVRMKLFGADSSVDGPLPSLELSPPGPVCQILTPRKGSTASSNLEIRILKTAGEGSGVTTSPLENNQTISETIRGQREFNSDWQRLSPHLNPHARATAAGFLPSAPQSADEEYLREYFSVADTMASHFQRVSTRFVDWYFFLLFIGGIVLEGGYYFYPMKGLVKEIDPFEIAYFIVMVILMSLYWHSKKRAFQDRYLDYRALAEALRVQLFWRLAGIRDSVADHYLAHQVGDMGWVCKALQAVHLPLAPPGSSDFATLRDHWVKDQLNYFKASLKKNTRMSGKFNKAGGVALALSLAWVILRIFSESWFDMSPDYLKYPLSAFYVVLAGTSVSAFVLFGYDKFRGFSEHAKRHLSMIPLYEMAMRVLSMPISDEAARQVVLQLGREALAENGYWVVLHHQQELDFG